MHLASDCIGLVKLSLVLLKDRQNNRPFNASLSQALAVSMEYIFNLISIMIVVYLILVNDLLIDLKNNSHSV